MIRISTLIFRGARFRWVCNTALLSNVKRFCCYDTPLFVSTNLLHVNMGAACVVRTPKDQDEVKADTDEAPPSKKDLLEPTSPISAMFDAMCEGI